MARTLVTGNILRSGSIPTTALGGGVVTSSLQIVASLPTGSLSSSAQVNYPDISNIPGGIASSSTQIKDYLPVDTVSSSVQVTAFLPTGTVSGSTQIDITGTTNYSTFSSSFATVDTNQANRLNSLESLTGSYATTGSNTFVAPQTISDTTNSTSYLDGALHVAGGMSVRKDVRISGSMTINGLLTAVSMSTQYVTASEYTIGTSKILLNDDDLVRFAGISIVDSGSSSPTTASIFWDSLQHRFIYENLSGSAYNSAILIAGPKNTGTLGDEVGLTDFRVPVAHGSDHIDSRLVSSSIRVEFPSRLTHVEAGLYVTGAISASGGINAGNGLFGTLQTAAQTNITSVGTLSSLTVSGNTNLATTSGNVGIGTTNPAAKLGIEGGSGAGIDGGILLDLYGGTISAADNGVGISFTRAGSQMAYIQAARENASNEAAILRFSTQTSAGTHPERMRIDSTGNVGIGTTNPGEKLTVNGSIGLQRAGTQYWHYAVNASNGLVFTRSGVADRMTLDSDGNLGLGVTPSASLHVKAANNEIMRLQSSDTTTGALYFTFYDSADAEKGYIGYGASANDNFYIVNRKNAAMGFFTNGTERIWIDSSGNVGIGTTTPRGRLHIGGDLQNGATDAAAINLKQTSTTAATGIYLERSGERKGYYIYVGGDLDSLNFQRNNAGTKSDVMTLTRDGNVGIGTTNPGTVTEIFRSSSDRNAITRLLTLNNASSNNPFDGFGTGILFKGNDYSNAVQNFAAIDAVMELTGLPSPQPDTAFAAGLRLYTGTNGALTERARISSRGYFKSSNTGAYNSGINGLYHEFNQSANDINVMLRGTNASLTTQGILSIYGTRNTTNNTYYGIAFINETTGEFRFRVSDGGNISTVGSIGLGTTTPPTNGVGVKFPATQNASSDANTLDDYEEGTWTPQIGGGTSGTKTAASGNGGYYTKIGRQVFCHGTLSWNSTDALSGTIQIKNLPFTSAGDRSGGSAGVIGGGGVTIESGFTYLVVVVDPGNTFAYLIQAGSTGYDHEPTIANSGVLYGFAFSYIV